MTLKKARPESKKQKRLTIKQARESIEMEDRLNSWQQRPESLAIILICAVGFLLAFAFGRYTNEVREVSAPIETTETIQQKLRPVIREEIEKSRDTTPAWMPKVERPLRERLLVWKDADPDRGGNWTKRIDEYFARNNHAPLEGEGRIFYLAAVDAGINPTLMPAIAMIESGGGRANANYNNFFGRKAVGGGWDSWATREAAIRNQAFYIARMWGKGANPYNMRGYCVPQFPWADKVAGEMARV